MAIRVSQAVSSVVPDPLVNQTATGITSAVGCGVTRIQAYVDNLELQRVIAKDGGMAGGRLPAC